MSGKVAKKKREKKKSAGLLLPEAFDIPNFTIHARVYALGEKYDILGLKTLSLEKFKREAEVHWDSDDFICTSKVAVAGNSCQR